jgi:AcrR family transcriptional regulator
MAQSDRLRRAERREQLLDSAVAILLDHGRGAVTMERVAAQAGVSKALPYAHFDNADDLVRVLRERELGRFAADVVAAVASAEQFEDRIAATVHAYFEGIRERGHVLKVLLDETPAGARRSDRKDLAFFARLFEDDAGLSAPVARIASSIFVAGVAGAVDSWLRRVASRATVEATVVRLIVGGVEALAVDESEGRL